MRFYNSISVPLLFLWLLASTAWAEPKMVVLLAEDDPSIRMTLAYQIRAAGYEVEWAENGETALAMFTRMPRRYFAVITDNNMPNPNAVRPDKYDGIRLAKAIREMDGQVPIFLQTLTVSPQIALAAQHAGITHSFRKPAGMDLIQRLRTLPRQGRPPLPEVDRIEAQALNILESHAEAAKNLEPSLSALDAIQARARPAIQLLKSRKKGGFFSGRWNDEDIAYATESDIALSKAKPEAREALQTLRGLRDEAKIVLQQMKENRTSLDISLALATSASKPNEAVGINIAIRRNLPELGTNDEHSRIQGRYGGTQEELEDLAELIENADHKITELQGQLPSENRNATIRELTQHRNDLESLGRRQYHDFISALREEGSCWDYTAMVTFKAHHVLGG